MACGPERVDETFGDFRAGDDGFRILVDGKLVYEKPKERSGVYLSVKTLAREVNRARRQRRPTTTYGSGREASNRTAADVPKYD